MPRDPALDQHFDFVRKVKAVMGFVFGLGAVVGIYLGADVIIVIGMAVMGGMMMDAPSITKLVSLVVKAIPWSKNGTLPPSEDERL